jgi:hypothetical protein
VQHLAVADALREEPLGGGERDAVGAPQQPAAVAFAVVGEALTGVPEHLGQQFGQRYVLRQRDVDPALGSTDRDSCEPDAHRWDLRWRGTRLRNGPHVTYHGPGATAGFFTNVDERETPP